MHQRPARFRFLVSTLTVLGATGAHAQATEANGASPAPASVSSTASSAAPDNVPPASSASPSGASNAPVASASSSSTSLHLGPVTFTPAGYIETYYAYNFNQPSNSITNYRGFDNRHNTFTLSNVVLDLTASLATVTVHFAAQVGSTPETYYLGEPTAPASGATGASSASVWKYLQQANIGWRTPLGRGLLLEAGLFLSPIGIEALAVKDSMNWSRSNLFFGLPFYHAGARASYPITDAITVSGAVWNGWNNVVDNNDWKSFSVSVAYSTPRLSGQLLYFSGVERSATAHEVIDASPAATAWRHLFDLWVSFRVLPRLELATQLDAGFEPNALGMAGWAAAALYARVHFTPYLSFAARGDVFAEFIPDNPNATSIFWNGARWVASGTGTLDLHLVDHLSVRLEYRHDEAERPIYFAGMVSSDANGYVANAVHQNTITLGATAWF